MLRVSESGSGESHTGQSDQRKRWTAEIYELGKDLPIDDKLHLLDQYFMNRSWQQVFPRLP